MRNTILLSLLLMLGITSLLVAQPRPGGRKPPQQPETAINESQSNTQDNLYRKFQGILVDRVWAERRSDDKGKDIYKKPSRITRIRLLSAEAMHAGYGILTKLPGKGLVFIPFNDTGNMIARDYVTNRCKTKKNIKIEVSGFINKDRVLQVKTMDSDSHTNNNANNQPRPEHGNNRSRP